MVDEAEDTTGDDRVDWRNPRACAIYIGSALYFGLSGLALDFLWPKVLIWFPGIGVGLGAEWSGTIETVAHALAFAGPVLLLALWVSARDRKHGRMSFVERSRSKEFHMGDMIVWMFLVMATLALSSIFMRAAFSDNTPARIMSFLLAIGCWPVIATFLRRTALTSDPHHSTE